MKEKNTLSSKFKRIYQGIHSMKFGMVLLLLISVLSIIGTILPQDRPLSFYQEEYSAFVYGMIETFQLDGIYHSWWFVGLIVLLSVNLLLCSILRLPSLIGKMKKEPPVPDPTKKAPWMTVREKSGKTPEEIFKAAGFNRPKKHSGGEGVLYRQKNPIGHLGSWFTHIGLLIIFVSYLFGQMTGFDTFFYGVTGVRDEIEGTEYQLAIDDFTIDYRDDFSVDQYTSNLRVFSSDDQLIKEGVTRVNDPMRVEGLSIYQNGTGWALDLDLQKDGEPLRSLTLYEGEIHVDDDQRIAIQFYDFFPDYIRHQGMPASQSPLPNNPHLLYILFYEGLRADMNVAAMGQEIVYEEYSFTVEDPRHFTYLQIVRDPGIPGALAGGILLTLGVFTAFYLHPKTLMVVKTSKGMNIYASAPRGEKLFHNNLTRRLKEGSHWD